MASSSTKIAFPGDNNQGVQVGHSSGTITNHFHAPAERPETPPPPSCFVPFRRDADFVDRGMLLDQIHERFRAPACRVALVGLGGVGKSQLAIEHCYRTAEQSSNAWVFWAHASNTARLEQSFREIADQVKIRGRNDPQADVFKLVHDWLRDVENGPWLLVLDNADDVAVLSPIKGAGGLQQHLSRYLPSSRHGSILVTSRTKSAAMQVVEDSDIILIEPMHDTAAQALLRKKLRIIDEEDDNIASLAMTLDHMPLALVQAAAYIQKRAPRCSIQQYLDEYRQSDRRKTSLLNQEAGHLRRDATASNSVLITWQISFDHIQKTRQSAAGLLSLMSFFDRQGIQEALLRPKSSTAVDDFEGDQFEEDVLVLRDYSFIKMTRDASTFEMHRLVQLAMRTWLENEGQLDKWREQFIHNLCAELPGGNYENWEKCQALFPHARAALAQRPKNRESLKEWALLLFKAAWYTLEQGKAEEAEEMATMSMEVRKEIVGEEDVETLIVMDMVGRARMRGGKYKGAEMMFRRALGFEKILGPERIETLITMTELATVLGKQGKYDEAEVIHRQTLVQKQKVLGHKHPETLQSMNNLAVVLEKQGKYEEAEAIQREVLAWSEKTRGHRHPCTLTSMGNLAVVLKRQGKYEEALSLYKRACAGCKVVFGKDHPFTRGCNKSYAIALVAYEQHLRALISATAESSSSNRGGKQPNCCAS